MIVLDTCAVLWPAFDRKKFSRATLLKLDRGPKLLISTMCFWEIGVKMKKGKLELPMNVRELCRLYAINTRVGLIPPDMGIVLASLDLDWENRDPVDRIVVATAQQSNLPIVTSDKWMCAFYSKTLM